MKFLVVDPLAGVQIFVRQLLQSHGVAAEQIICCANTDAALSQGLAFKPDVLITDWFASAPLTGPPSPAVAAFDPTGHTLATAFQDGTVLHSELVPAVGQEPDYDAAIAALS